MTLTIKLLTEAIKKATIRPAKIVGFKRVEGSYIDADLLIKQLEAMEEKPEWNLEIKGQACSTDGECESCE